MNHYLLTALGEKDLLEFLEANLIDFDDPDGWISHAEALATIADITYEQGVSDVVIEIGAHESVSGHAESHTIEKRYFQEVQQLINGATQ
tara:strand:+ start:385 stop:654 length:270 start_codon:yes stop_codon:yes gene_type:complete